MIIRRNSKEISKEDYQTFYRETKRIGEGSYGDVYAIQHYKTHQQFAMKRLLPTKQSHREDANRQIQILKTMKHQNIVQMHQYYIYRPRSLFYRQKLVLQELGIIMEKAQCSLQDLIESHIKKGQFLNRQQIWTFALQFLNLFLFLQKQQIAHCDVKPANILIFHTENLQLCCKLSDFGLAKIMTRQQDLNKLGGSEHYASPNVKIQLKKKRVMFPTNAYKDDVYSLGVTLYELVTLRKNEEQVILNSNIRQMIEANSTKKKDERQELYSVRKQIVQTTGSQLFLHVLQLMLQNSEEKRPAISEIVEAYKMDLDLQYKRILEEEETHHRKLFIRQEQAYNRKTIKMRPNHSYQRNNQPKRFEITYQQQQERSMPPMHQKTINQNQDNNRQIMQTSMRKKSRQIQFERVADRTQIVFQTQEHSFEKGHSISKKCGHLKSLFNINDKFHQSSYSSPQNSIMAVCSVDQDKLLLGFSDGTLAVLINFSKILMSEAEASENIVHLDLKMKNFVSSIQKDQLGNIWIAGGSNCIKIINSQFFYESFLKSIKVLTQKHYLSKYHETSAYSRKLFCKIQSEHLRVLQFKQTNSGISFLSCKNLDNYAIGFYDGFITVKQQNQTRRYFGHKKPVSCIRVIKNCQRVSGNKTIISSSLDGTVVKLNMSGNERPIQIYPNRNNQDFIQDRTVHQELTNLGLLQNNFSNTINNPKRIKLKPIIGIEVTTAEDQANTFIITFLNGKRQEIKQNGSFIRKRSFANPLSNYRQTNLLQQENQVIRRNQKTQIEQQPFQNILSLKTIVNRTNGCLEGLYLNQKGQIAKQSKVFFDLGAQITHQERSLSGMSQNERSFFKKDLNQKTRGWNCMANLVLIPQNNPHQQIDLVILGSYKGYIAIVTLN